MILFEIFILFLAGIGAGAITGLVSASAVNIVMPILVLVLGFSAYDAIGISLAIDVFASTASAFVYRKKGNVKIMKSLSLLLPALFFVIVGSYFSKSVPSESLSVITGIGIFFAGISIFGRKEKNIVGEKSKHGFILPILVGCLIGLVAGFFGGGGGMMIFFALIFLLNYNIHEAVGTSVFLMIFIAFFGGAGHYFYSPFSLWLLIPAGVGALVAGFVFSSYANRIDSSKLKKIGGAVIMVLGLTLALRGVFL